MMNGRAIFTLIIVLLMAVLIIYSVDYNPTARSIPIVVGSMVLFMSLVQLLGDMFPTLSERFAFLGERNNNIDDSKQIEENIETKEQIQETDKENPSGKDSEEDWSQIFISFIWLIGFVVLLFFTSYLLAVPLFLFFYTWLAGKTKPSAALGIAIGMGLFMFVLFDLLLGATF
jgi:hypothetical protein